MYSIDSLRTFIDNLEQKDFYKYLLICIGVITSLVFLTFLQYYRAVSALTSRIDEINEQREEIQRILTVSKRIKTQRQEIDAILARDEGFKIGHYFNTILSKFGLADKKRGVDYSHIDHGNAYRENILKAKLTDMNMKELSELLYEIEQNPRVYSKELEIVKSRKYHNSLDVNLTIATLEPRSLTTE